MAGQIDASQAAWIGVAGSVIGGLVGGFVGAIGGWLIARWQWTRASRAQAREARRGAYEGVVDLMRQQLDRITKMIDLVRKGDGAAAEREVAKGRELNDRIGVVLARMRLAATGEIIEELGTCNDAIGAYGALMSEAASAVRLGQPVDDAGLSSAKTKAEDAFKEFIAKIREELEA